MNSSPSSVWSIRFELSMMLEFLFHERPESIFNGPILIILMETPSSTRNFEMGS